jgi:hypothetical protein
MNAPRFYRSICFALLATLTWQLPSADSHAAVSRIEILTRSAYADGRSFEGIGPYERLIGRVHFTVDAQADANERVIDLKYAPRNDEGFVKFTADLEILVPVDRTKASGTLLYDVNNRGHRLALKVFNEEADDFLMRQGIVVVWSGWLAEVHPLPDNNVERGALLRLDAPIAREFADEKITDMVRAEVVTELPVDQMNITGREQLGSYEPTNDGMNDQRSLSWRLRERDPRVYISRKQWQLKVTPIDAPGQLYCLPKVEISVNGGIKPGYIYEVMYEAQDPVVQGLGLTSIRDLVSFLKYNTTNENPLALEKRSVTPRAVGFGVSQSGRCLRVLLYEGFNADEEGRQVFDGIIPHVAGAGQGFFNHRFAMPSAFNGQHNMHDFPCDMFPFAYEREEDITKERTDGLLERARTAQVVPKIMHIQNSSEYWHRAGSLVHTDPNSKRDGEIPPEVRLYSIGGAQHSWGNDLTARPPFYGTLINNPTDYRPHLRAMLIAMIAWIKDGTLPPESIYPRIDQGNLVSLRGESPWYVLPGIRYPDLGQMYIPYAWNFGPDFTTKGIIEFSPPGHHGLYLSLVPDVDEDNNEKGMLKLPFLRVPMATYTGWNMRDAKIGAEQELLMLKGGYIPFARTKAEREKSGDPRLSLEERYQDADDYLQKLQVAIDDLVIERHLLAEDAPRLMERGKKMAEVFAEKSQVPKSE